MREGQPSLKGVAVRAWTMICFWARVVISWRWRCQNESVIIPGSALHIFKYPEMTLADWRAPRVNLKALRCSCGGFVRAFAPKS
jgi:hypothetical protein